MERLSAFAAFVRLAQTNPVPIVLENDGGALADYAARPSRRTNKERAKTSRDKKLSDRLENIAVLDMETDPFDNNRPDDKILPYLAVLYSDKFETVIIWEEDYDSFVYKLIAAIEAIPNKYTIYAHNGGKFDFMFFVHKLRGKVSFKGRGIMAATIGNHELRDSYHIIPERLAAYKKDSFDYSTLTKSQRHKHKETIISYCIADCRYLLDLVRKFITAYGFKISVGAAALAAFKNHYKYESLSDYQDNNIRQFYYGGRVECLAGKGHFLRNFKLYDVNSMYPYAMAKYKHPTASEYVMHNGKPNPQTVFLEIVCYNNGALMGRLESGELTSRISHGKFMTTIYEYQTALELGLISNVEIISCLDNYKLTDFHKFVDPIYTHRAAEKTRLDTLDSSSAEYDTCKAAILFDKLILNNAYGKFATNPRKFKEHFITSPYQRPEELDMDADGYGDAPEFDGETHWIWSKPAEKMKFLNVGTAASITGAARSVLMRAIHNAHNPVYCDTDSLICEELRESDIHKTRLGAWDIEKEITELIVCGKKLYAYRDKSGKEYIKSKGVQGLNWNDMLEILHGSIIEKTNFAPTLTRRGNQGYITRRIRATTRASDERQKANVK